MRPVSFTQVAWIHSIFALTGVLTTLLGPILPELSLRWSLSDAQAGAFFAAQFSGSIVGALLSSPLVVRRGFRVTLGTGIGVMTAGVAVLGSLSSWVVAVAAVFCYGVGLGMVIPTANLWVAEVNPHGRGSALNLLNLSWGVGAVACPLLAAWAQRAGRIPLLLFGLAALSGVFLITGASQVFDRMKKPPAQRADPLLSKHLVWRSHFLPFLGALFFLYVGTENAVAGWVATYSQRLSSSRDPVWLLAPSFFWGALLLGRALAPWMLRQTPESSLVRRGLLLGAGGVATLLVAKAPGVVLLGTSLSGLGLATVFPLLISLLAQVFGTAAQRVAGILFGAAALGGATLPWLVGTASTHFGSLKVGLVIPLLSTVVMLPLYAASRRAHMGGWSSLAER